MELSRVLCGGEVNRALHKRVRQTPQLQTRLREPCILPFWCPCALWWLWPFWSTLRVSRCVHLVPPSRRIATAVNVLMMVLTIGVPKNNAHMNARLEMLNAPKESTSRRTATRVTA